MQRNGQMLIDIEKIRGLRGKPGVLDNNVITDLTELECMGLINVVFSRVLIPLSILEAEVTQDSLGDLDNLEYAVAAMETLDSFSLFKEISTKKKGLTEYDVEVIVIAREKAVLCTSNEKQIRTTCREYGIEHTGTVGILCCAFEHKEISRETFERLMYKLFNESSCRLGKGIKKDVIEYYGMEF